ncbi:MAG: hypothetical protein V1865_01330 [bacterium]
MKKFKILYLVIGILIGIFLFILGEYDDSPGAQLLGLIVIITNIIVFIKQRKNN